MQSATRQKWTGRWQQLAGKAKELWGKLTDDELKQAEGRYEALVGKLHEKSGETWEAIEKKWNDAWL